MGNRHRESHPQNNQHRAPGGGCALTGTRNRDLMEGTWEAVPGRGQGRQDPGARALLRHLSGDGNLHGSPCRAAVQTVPAQIVLLCGCPVLGCVHGCVHSCVCLLCRSHGPPAPSVSCPIQSLGHLGQVQQGICACVLVLECALKMSDPS